MVPIAVRHLTKRFGKTVALDDVSLNIEEGELFFLLGPSGCGKTTLLRSLAGFYRPDEGKIFFGSRDVTFTPAHQRNTAMMFQSYALWPHMTVARNVAFGLEERKTPKEEIEMKVGEALGIVQMAEYADRKINQLSGGQQQRVALARALVVRPQCLFLDEPLSNLDAKLRMEMREEIRRICKEFGLTGVYVTHDQKEALSMADRMAILDEGRILQTGTPEEVYRTPVSKTVAEFIGETNLVEGVVRGPVEGKERCFLVETSAGDFEGLTIGKAWNPAQGERCTLSIRPECWVLVEEEPDSNFAIGRIKTATYLGEIAQYHLRTPAGLELKVSELNPVHLSRAGSHEALFAWADPVDIVILPG